jgi:hypothetical protein
MWLFLACEAVLLGLLNPLIPYVYYFLPRLTAFTRLPIPILLFSLFFLASSEPDISPFVLGVLLETRLVGLQYSFLPPAPQDFTCSGINPFFLFPPF